MSVNSARRERIREVINNPYVRAVLDMIAKSEIGDDSVNGAGYDVAFGNNKRFTSYAAHPGMSGQYVDNQGNKRTSTAAGRYQFLESTVRDLNDRYGFTDFSPKTQDEMAIALMMDVGALDDILRGDIAKALPKLGRRWASLPTSEAGRQLHGTRSTDFVYGAYNDALRHWSNGAEVVYPTMPARQTTAAMQTPVTVDMPQTPVTVDMPQTPDFGLSMLDQLGDIRDQLNSRYRRRRMLATAPGPLTQQTGTNLARAIFAAPPGTPLQAYPSYHVDEATLIQQPAVDRDGQPIRVSNTPAPMMTTVPGNVQLEAPAEYTFNDLGQPVSISSNFFSDGMGKIIADNMPVQVAADNPPAVTPEQYMADELNRNRQQANKDFLRVSALSAPFAEELRRLIRETPVTITG